jgi:hypothetical protein
MRGYKKIRDYIKIFLSLKHGEKQANFRKQEAFIRKRR